MSLSALDTEWRQTASGLKAYSGGVELLWTAQPGSQACFLGCNIVECLYEGERGPGKTDALLMDFLQEVGKGYGADWRGILFRRTYPELADVIAKTRAWFKQFCPAAKFNEANSTWEFPDGERLLLRHFPKPSTYWSYHGHAYPWIAWEELCTWPTDECFKSMFSCSRSTRMGMPRRIRATANPYGVGHNWVKTRYRLPVAPGSIRGPVIRDSKDLGGNTEPPRVAIHGRLAENKIMLAADPDYISRLRAAARNEAELAAWVEGSWDIVAGGMLDDIWGKQRARIVVPDFDIPATWRITRSLDWGQSKPSSVGFYATSDGSDIKVNGKRRSTVRGDKFRVGEIYTWNGRPNEGNRITPQQLARLIVEYELMRGWRDEEGTIVRAGPSDNSIFDPTATGPAIADEMAKSVRLPDGSVHRGPRFVEADKGPGSRKQGWSLLRQWLSNTAPGEGLLVREKPGLFIVGDRCPQWLRTVPTLPRDEKDQDDVDTEAEDHAGDETRYHVKGPKPISSGQTEGT